MRKHLLVVLVLAVAVMVLAGCLGSRFPAPLPTSVASPQPPEETPVSRDLMVSGVPGLYLAWGSPADAIPPPRPADDPLAPANYPIGIDCLAYLGSGGDVGAKGVWDVRSAIDWSVYDNCLRQAASRIVTLSDGSTLPQPVILTLPASFSDTGSRWYATSGHGAPGSSDNPYIRLHLPPWMQNDLYRFTFTAPSGRTYQSIRYSGEFKQRMIEFLQAAGARYNDNTQIAAVRVYLGVQGESQPVVRCQTYWDALPPAGADNLQCGTDSVAGLLAQHEAVVSCSDYRLFVRDLTDAALAAFPDKPILTMADASPCASMSGAGLREWLFDGRWAGKQVGVSMNNLNADRPDVDERPGNILTEWNKWRVGRTFADLGRPMLYEFDGHPPSTEAMYWTVLSGAGNGGRFILYHSPWKNTFSQPTWDIVDYWLTSDRRAWLIFRDREYPTYDFSPGRGTSGSIGDWGRFLRLLNSDDAPQACSAAVARTARAANAAAIGAGGINVTPACPLDLPAPVPSTTPSPQAALLSRLFDRQARRLESNRSLYIVVDPRWPAFGATGSAEVTVSYLDTGRDTFDVILPGANGRPLRHTIVKTGTGLWQRASWSGGIIVDNQLGHTNFVEIINDGSGAEYLHEVYVSAPARLGPAATATLTSSSAPTVASAASDTPTWTLTPVPSSTLPASSTPTPSPAPPSATLTVSRTPTVAPTSTPTRLLAPAPKLTSTPEFTPAPTPSLTPAPTATFTAAPTRTPTPSATSTPTQTVTPSLTPSATASSTPASTSTPIPTPNRAACPVQFIGSLSLDTPRAIAAGPVGLYVAEFETSSLALLNPTAHTPVWQQRSGIGRTNGVAVWGDFVVAANRDAGTVTLHAAASGVQLATIPVGQLPWGISTGAGRAYVANYGDQTLSIIDLAQRRLLATVPVAPLPIMPVLAEGQLYLLHWDGLVSRFDTNGAALGQVSAGVNDTRGLAYDPLRRRLYVGSQNGAVVGLDLPTLQPVARFELPGPAYAIQVNPLTGRIFTVDAQGDKLYVVDADTGDVQSIALPAQGGEQGGQGLAVWNNYVAVSNLAANSVSFFSDTACPDRLTPTAQPFPAATSVDSNPPPTAVSPAATNTAPAFPPKASATPTLTPPASATLSPTVVRAKIEVVWPHGGADVQDADHANVTAYLLAGDGLALTHAAARSLLNSVPCDWTPVVRLWAAVDNQPAHPLGIGTKRMVTDGGRRFPAWDFNDVDVSAARDPANKMAFFVTVDDGPAAPVVLHNVWTHAADARTLFPQQDAPASATNFIPASIDARIQIVWPHGGLSVQEASTANVTAYLFASNTNEAVAPETGWAPTVRLHMSVNNEPEAAPGEGIVGVRREVTAVNGVKFLAWDFNDVDVSLANDSLNRLYFWVTVDGVNTYSNIWTHAVDARTLFPQPDVLNSCQ